MLHAHGEASLLTKRRLWHCVLEARKHIYAVVLKVNKSFYVRWISFERYLSLIAATMSNV